MAAKALDTGADLADSASAHADASRFVAARRSAAHFPMERSRPFVSSRIRDMPVQLRLSVAHVAHPLRVGRSFGAHHSLKVTLQRG